MFPQTYDVNSDAMQIHGLIKVNVYCDCLNLGHYTSYVWVGHVKLRSEAMV